MEYDPIELMKLNLTEKDIQKVRDMCLEMLTAEGKEKVKYAMFTVDYVYLPFIIDMFDGYEVGITPTYALPNCSRITVTLI